MNSITFQLNSNVKLANFGFGTLVRGFTLVAVNVKILPPTSIFTWVPMVGLKQVRPSTPNPTLTANIGETHNQGECCHLLQCFGLAVGQIEKNED